MTDFTFLIAAGLILIVLGFFLIAYGTMRSGQETGGVEERRPDQEIREKKVRGGGVILIGPFPIVFGTDKRVALIAMILSIVVMVMAILFLK